MSPEMDQQSILGLAESILAKTKDIVEYLKATDCAVPTFATNSEASPRTREYKAMQSNLKDYLEDLQRLIEGPEKFYRHFAMRGYELAAMQIALDFSFFTLVPTKGEISLQELASRAGLDKDRTSRVMRLLITHRLFSEHRPGLISHNSFSIALQDKELRSVVHYSLDEMIKAATESGTYMKGHPFESDGLHCPFYSRHGVPIFQYYSKHPEAAGRFASAMAGWRRMENSVIELRDNFHWAALRGTVVDIGGGSGHMSVILAREFPQLKFVVQDETDDMLGSGQNLLTDDVRDRVSFAKVNFFQPQPYKGAAAYLLRQCTHNWADKDVVTMFKAVVPGLEGSAPDTPLLINDIVLPEPGTVSRLSEREMRQADMVMMVCFGAKQRTKAEFEALLKEADTRYEIHRVHDQGALGLLEVYLRQ